MSKDRKCPDCGTELAGSSVAALCPRCLLQVGAHLGPDETQTLPGATEAVHPGVSTGAGRPSFWEFHADVSAGRFGNYELMEEIARGGMGIVYRARQVSLDRIVALKVLLAGPLATNDFVQRFRTEASAAASLQHPNIVAIHEVGFAEGQHFFAMDYVEGVTLAQLAAKGPLPGRRAATYLKVIAEAIHFAHERNVLHRDLKPSNVLVDSATDQPRLTDFGLAKRLDAETDLTISGQVLGSPNYMSPEQAVARRGTVGKHSDVYSLGAIFYHLLTGRPPFQGEALTDVLHQVINDDPLALHLLIPRVPPELETICLKCLEKEPKRRYWTAQELADELGRFLRNEPILARPLTPVEQACRWYRRNPALASLAAAFALVFTLGFGGTLWQWQKAKDNWQLAERNRERVEQDLYDSDMRLAQHEWDNNDLGSTRRLLETQMLQTGRKDWRSFEWFYLWRLCQGDPHLTLPGHAQSVTALAYSPDGKRLATGSVGSPVFVWDCVTGKIMRRLPEQNVVSLAFAADGNSLGVGGRDQVVVWNLETGRPDFKLEEALGEFRIAFSPRGTFLAIGTHGGTLQLDGGTTELWNYVTRKRKCVFPESGGHVVFSPRGDQLATRNSNQSTKIWNVATEELVTTLKTGDVIAAAFSPDGQTLATTSWGLQVNFWDVTSSREIGSLTNIQSRVWSLAFSPDGLFLVTGGADQAIRIWNMATRRQTEQLKGHGGEVTCVAFSPDGLKLASGSKDCTAMIWSVHQNRTVENLPILNSRPIFSPDSQWVAAGIGNNQVAAWDVATLGEKVVFAGAWDAIAFSDDSRNLITRGSNYLLRTFNVATQAARETIPGRAAQETDSFAGLSPNGKELVIGLDDKTVTFSDVKTGVITATHALLYPSLVSFSPDGKLFATTVPSNLKTNRFGTAIWDMRTHRLVKLLAGHTDWVLAQSFSPDSKILATGSADDSVKFWDTATWKEIPPSFGHKEYVPCLAFSPNGRTLATVCADGTMKLWNTATRRELASLKVGQAKYITFSPDSQNLAVWSWGDVLRLWRAPILDLMRQSQPKDG